MKKLLLLTLFPAILLSQLIYAKDFVFLVDIHDVMIARNTRESARRWIKLCREYGFKKVSKLHKFRRYACRELVLEELTRESKHREAIMDAFIKFANSQHPQEKVIRIIQQLEAQGYQIYIFSNIGPQTLEQLREKDGFEFLQNWPVAFIGTQLENEEYVVKPSPESFEMALAQLAEQNVTSENSVFFYIDDKEENILEAQRHGIMGIRFKSAKQLEKNLKKLHLLPKEFSRKHKNNN